VCVFIEKADRPGQVYVIIYPLGPENRPRALPETARPNESLFSHGNTTAGQKQIIF